MIIDSHAHYARAGFNDSFRFLTFEDGAFQIREGRRATVLQAMKEAGIAGSVEPGIELASNPAVLQLCEQYPDFIFPVIGVHPTRVHSLRWKDRKTIAAYAENKNVVGIGETGLDYHLKRKEQHRVRQLFWFWFHICLANRMKLPLVLHIRMAYKDAVKILKMNKRKLHGGVVHCFCGSAQEASEFIALGFSIGIGGALLQNDDQSKQLQEAVRSISLERIVVETDAPFVLPHFETDTISKKAKRKIRNTSFILPAVIRRIAELKETDHGIIEAAVFRNTIKLFGLHSFEH